MGRHDGVTIAARRRSRPLLAVPAVTVLVLLAALATPSVLPGFLPGVRAYLPWFPSATCPPTTIEVVTPLEITSAVQNAVAAVQGRELPDGTCSQIQVRAQAPHDTVDGSTVLPPTRAPHVWISDSSLWAGQVHSWKLQKAGSFGSTPVVLVSNASTLAPLGWQKEAPSWLSALDGARPLASPQLSTSTAGLLAMQALWQAGGRNAVAERRLAAALLAIGRNTSSNEYQALRAAEQGTAEQPFVASTERAMLAVNADSNTHTLAAVYPAEGSPYLDYPVYRVAPQARTSAQNTAVTAVVAAVTGAAGRAAARAAYLRDPAGADPPDGVSTRTVKELAAPTAADRTTFLTRLTSIARPSRILLVVDVSESMQAEVPGIGLSRIQLAGRAAAAAGDLLTDGSSVGLWIFAVRLDGDKPYRELSPIAALGSQDGSRTHREALDSSLLQLDTRLRRGGTGLYETARDAVRTLRQDYDPRAVNTVVLLTDGADQNTDDVTLEQLVQGLALDAAAAPDRQVRLVGIALGADADMASLQAIVAPTKGKAYRADTPAALQQVLYDAVAQRS